MPADWIGELQQAALSADTDWIATLSAQIPPTHTDLRDGLQHYVDHFRFDKITEHVRMRNAECGMRN